MKIRIGIVGLGENTRLRHVPGFRACSDVEIHSVCNRSRESTEAIAHQLEIPRTHLDWQQLVDDPNIDAVVIGTWPYIHCPVTIRALEAGKHVLSEARMATNLAEARLMLETSRKLPHLVAQIVPSPFGLRADRVVRDLLNDGFLGELREVVVLSTSSSFADPRVPIHWRKVAKYSGKNMLDLGILHETLGRWIPEPVRVYSQSQIFTKDRLDPETDKPADVESPDSVQILTCLPNGARALYQLSDSIHFGFGTQIHLYGDNGTLKYLLGPEDCLLAGQCGDETMHEVRVPSNKQGGWRVEADFIDAIRETSTVQFTNFASGVRYMEFTEAVAQSAETGRPVELPLP